LTDLEEKKLACDQKVAELNTALKKETTDKETANELSSENRNNLTKAQSAHKDHQQTCKEQGTRCNETTASLKMRYEEIESLNNALVTCNQNVTDLKDKERACDEKVAKLDTTLTKQANDAKTAKALFNMIQNNMTDAQHVHKDKQKTCDKLGTEFNKTTTSLKIRYKEIKSLNDTLVACNQKVTDLKDKELARDKKVAKLETALKTEKTGKEKAETLGKRSKSSWKKPSMPTQKSRNRSVLVT